jgi:hypothetical protein
MLDDSVRLTPEARPELLNGVTVIRGRAIGFAYDRQRNLEKRAQDFVAIPYYSWANRGPGQMMVWIPTSEAAVVPVPAPTIASASRVSSSANARNPIAVNDQSEPRSSRDNSDIYMHWWPQKGITEWVEYAFAAPATVSEAEVYWYDDTGRGECRTPVSWRLLYKVGDDWKPIEVSGPYGVDKDRFNKVAFKQVTTTGLRLEVVMQKDWSAGIQEWVVR